MNLPHYKPGLSLEAGVRKDYMEALGIIQNSENPSEQLEQVAIMTRALKKSRAPPERKIEYAAELIKAYRHLGEVIDRVVKNETTVCRGAERQLEDSLNTI